MKELSSRFKRNRFIEVLLFCIWSFNQFLGYSQCFLVETISSKHFIFKPGLRLLFVVRSLCVFYVFREEQQRRNDVSKYKIFIKVLFNNKEVSKTAAKLVDYDSCCHCILCKCISLVSSVVLYCIQVFI